VVLGRDKMKIYEYTYGSEPKYKRERERDQLLIQVVFLDKVKNREKAHVEFPNPSNLEAIRLVPSPH